MVELRACNLHLWTNTLICRGSKAYIVPEESNAQQSVPQRADTHELISQSQHPVYSMGVCGFN